VQIFDSWAGDVPAEAMQRLVVEPIAAIIDGVRAVYPNFPVIVFARGVGDKHGLVARGTGANCVGLEEDVVASEILKQLPDQVAVQGNLANALLLGDDASMLAATRKILTSVPRERHIFNLGHGILPQTEIGMVERLVQEVRAVG
jgi:uroporphyrinogen decarboxylase